MLPQKARILPDRDDTRNWYLDEDVRVTLHNGDCVEIPKGYRFDAHSVPWLFRWAFPKNKGDDIYAALVHDYLIDTSPFHRYPRSFMDYEYGRFMSMPEYKVSEMRATFMPAFVKLYGYLRFTIWGDDRGDYTKHRTTVSVKIEQEDRMV